MSYARTKVWVWFKGGLDGGEWRGGFYATDNAEQVVDGVLEGFLQGENVPGLNALTGASGFVTSLTSVSPQPV